MAESKPTKETALAYLTDLTDKCLKFGGKPGYNPHFFVEKEVKPLVYLVSNTTGSELDTNIAKAMALKFDEQKLITNPENIVKAPEVKK